MPRPPRPQYLYAAQPDSVTLMCSVNRSRHRAVERWAEQFDWQLHNLWRYIIAAGMEAFREAPMTEEAVGTHDPSENLERQE